MHRKECRIISEFLERRTVSVRASHRGRGRQCEFVIIVRITVVHGALNQTAHSRPAAADYLSLCEKKNKSFRNEQTCCVTVSFRGEATCFFFLRNDGSSNETRFI